MSRRWIALLLAAALTVVGGVGLGCGEEARTTVVQAPPVLVEPVRVQDVRDRIEATGQLLARSKATLAAQVGGQITRIHVDEGASVESGQVILEIDPELRHLEVSSQRARVTEARAQLADSERESGRVESLRSRGAVSQADVDQAQTRLELARSRLEAAQAQLGLAERALADSNVSAPFSGKVARRFVSAGEFVAAGTHLFSLVALEDMEVEFHLPERDSSLVSEGDPVTVRVAPFPDEVFAATVIVVSPTIDPRTRTLRVKARVENREGRLRPGLFARADLGVSERQGVVMVPEDAILIRSDGTVLFRLSGENEVQRVTVETGVRMDGLVEITSGVGPGDAVVVRGQTRLVDGSVVDVRTANGQKAVGVAAGAPAEGSP
jgi:membrane fusion protein (multidrug efflux system)